MRETDRLDGVETFTEYLTTYPQAMACGEQDPAAVFDRHHTAGFVLTNDGQVFDREALIAHARPARKNVTDLRIDVHQVVATGRDVAARYTMTAHLRRGPTVTTEIYLFGRRSSDGLLSQVDQLTRTVSPSQVGPAESTT